MYSNSSQIRLGDDLFLPCSFTIMEGRDVEILFGLDMLKRFQAVIDLSKNSLVVQGKTIRFLDEHELPVEARMMEGAVDAEGNPVPEAQASGSGGAEAQQNAQAAQNTANRENQPEPFPGSGQSLAGPVASASAGVPGSGMSWNHPPATASSSQPQQSSSTQSQPQSQSQHPPESIKSLTDLGATPQQAVTFLDAAGGNVEIAASLLFQQ